MIRSAKVIGQRRRAGEDHAAGEAPPMKPDAETRRWLTTALHVQLSMRTTPVTPLARSRAPSCCSSARSRSSRSCLALAAYAGDDRLALDFHHELYPQAEAVVDGRDAYDPPDADLSDRANFLWPMAAVLPVVPLTVLPPGAADWLATALVLATLVAALWVLGVRDWRVYGVVLLWPSVIEAIQTANASLPLDAARRADVALSRPLGDRRHRARLRRRAEVLPLAARRLARARSDGARAAAIAARRGRASLLLLLPFTSIADYVRLLRNLGGDVRARRVHAVRAAHATSGVPDTAARVVTVALGLGRARARVAPTQPRARDRGGARPLADRLASLLRPAPRPARALASTIRRRLAHSHRPVGRRRHVQRRARGRPRSCLALVALRRSRCASVAPQAQPDAAVALARRPLHAI